MKELSKQASKKVCKELRNKDCIEKVLKKESKKVRTEWVN
jgi:hypothetical protein